MSGKKCPVPFLQSTPRAATREKVPDTYFPNETYWSAPRFGAMLVLLDSHQVLATSAPSLLAPAVAWGRTKEDFCSRDVAALLGPIFCQSCQRFKLLLDPLTIMFDGLLFDLAGHL